MLTDQLTEIIGSLGFLTFELTVALGLLILLLVGLMVKNELAIKILYVVILVMAALHLPHLHQAEALFGETMLVDEASNILKLLMVIASVWIVFFPTSERQPVEFYILLLAMVLGSALMMAANNLLVIYLVVELASFSAYLLTNFNFQKRSFEAGVKYLIFGGVTSAFALYGASLMYGFTGTLDLNQMDLTVIGNPILLKAGIFLFCGSLFFKISAVPFHIWTPSAYQEAPTGSVMIMSVVPKLGGLFLLHRVLNVAEFREEYWLYSAVAVFGIATITIGTLGALRQTNIKRMVAYGAIAHSGFLMAPLLIPFDGGASAFIWYAVGYAVINIALFYLISIYESLGATEIQDYAGLGKISPFMGALVLIVMIALVGLPPTVGFTIKFYLFVSIWEWYQSVQDPYLLTYLIVAVASVVFSLFFYLKIPYQMFLKDSDESIIGNYSLVQKLIATIFTTILLWLFLSPKILNNIANNFIQTDW
ncbi:MAG: NADH-quinone oxidoreductase subunit N [Cyclobacteriaceae bacterium]